MQYVERAPDPRLAGRVRYWRLTGAAGDAQGFDPVLPDGYVEVIVHLGDPFRVREDGSVRLQPRTLLAGPGTAPVELAPTGRIDVVGVRMEAGVGAELLRQSMAPLVDRLPELGEVAGTFARDLAEELAEEREPWNAVLDRRLLAALAPPDALVDWAVGRLRAARGRVTVDELAREAGLSARQLERRFGARVGYGPKMLARIVRFQHAWGLLAAPGTRRMADVAALAGYYDQAHLVRDFRQFAREVPSRLLEAERELTSRFRS